MAKTSSKTSEKSILWVVIASLAVVTALGWALVAASYAHAYEGWRSAGAVGPEDDEELGDTPGLRRRAAGRIVIRETARALFDFVANAFRQIPNAPWVVAHAFRDRLWLVVTIATVQGLVVFGGWKLRQLERHLARSARRKPRKMAVPKRHDGEL